MSLIENTKEIAELVKKLGNIDLYRKIVELEGEVIEISRQKLQLEQKVDELQKSIKLKSQILFKEPVYFCEGDETPFCPTCYEKDGIMIHMNRYAVTNQGRTNWLCVNCRTDVYYPPPS